MQNANGSSAHNPAVNPFLLRMIWAALVASTVIYLAFAFMMKSGRGAAVGSGVLYGPNFNDLFQAAVTVIAALDFAAAFVVSKILWEKARKKLLAEGGGMSAARAEEELGQRRGDFLAKLSSAFFLGFLMRMVLLESVAILGFAMTLQAGGQATQMIPFFLAAFLGQLTCFPSEERMRAAVLRG